MKSLKLFISVLLYFNIVSCTEEKKSTFQYEILNNIDLCALKPPNIYESNYFSSFDTFFRDINENPNDELSRNVYEQSLKNLSNKESKYIFCISKDNLKSEFLETYIQVELQKGKKIRQFTFFNYLCLKNDNLINYKKRENAIESCQ